MRDGVTAFTFVPWISVISEEVTAVIYSYVFYLHVTSSIARWATRIELPQSLTFNPTSVQKRGKQHRDLVVDSSFLYPFPPSSRANSQN